MGMPRLDPARIFDLLDALPSPAWVEDAEGRIVHANPRAGTLRRLDVVVPGAPGESRPAGAITIPFEGAAPDGGVLYVRLLPEDDAAGALDTTLSRALLAASAQDLRNIRQVVAMIREALAAPGGAEAAVPLATSALERALAWGQDLVSVFRVVTPGVRRTALVDALRLLRTTSTLGRTLMRGIPNVRIDVSDEAAWLRADDRDLARAFLTLLVTAGDSARRGKARTLAVSAHRSGAASLCVEVRHDGHGGDPGDPLVSWAHGAQGRGVWAAFGEGTRVTVDRAAPRGVRLELRLPVGGRPEAVPAGPPCVWVLGSDALLDRIRARIRGGVAPIEVASPGHGCTPRVFVWDLGATTRHEPDAVAAVAAAWRLRGACEIFLVCDAGGELTPAARVLARLGARVVADEALVPAIERVLGRPAAPESADAPRPRIHEAS